MVKFTDRPAMTIAVDMGRKATKTKTKTKLLILYVTTDFFQLTNSIVSDCSMEQTIYMPVTSFEP